MNLFQNLLCDFKWYRKKMGGSWYYVKDTSTSGFSSDIIGWVRKISGSMEVIKREDYEQSVQKKEAAPKR